MPFFDWTAESTQGKKFIIYATLVGGSSREPDATCSFRGRLCVCPKNLFREYLSRLDIRHGESVSSGETIRVSSGPK